MIALIIFCASLPAIFCVGCAAFLAFKERKQWVWFAGLSVLAGMGGLTVLNMMQIWRYHA